jgi:hypothetical protein
MPMQADFIVSKIVGAKDAKEDMHLTLEFKNIPSELATLWFMTPGGLKVGKDVTVEK